jgi:hypothetical protein
MHRSASRLAAALLAAPLMLAALGACADDPAASRGAPDPSSGAKLSFPQYQLELARCLRSQGVDMPDPTGDGGIAIGIPAAGSQDEIQAAAQFCRDKLGPPPAMSEQERRAADAAARERLLKMTECYRQHGVDVADPRPGELPAIPQDVPVEVVDACGGAAVSARIAE